MATFVLIHGGGGDSTYWQPLTADLDRRGHSVIAVDLPNDDANADLFTYAATAITATAGHRDVIVVGHSYGGFTAPIVAEHLQATLLVLLQAMIPEPGESAAQWWENTGHTQAQREQAEADGRDPDADVDLLDQMLQDTPRELADEMFATEHGESAMAFEQPWPLPAWPAIPTRVLVSRADRFFPLKFMQRVSRDRLSVEPDVMPGDHFPMLGHPAGVAQRLDTYWRELRDRSC